jgi:hypothetical protein
MNDQNNPTDARPRSEKQPGRGNATDLRFDDGTIVEQPANRGAGDTSPPAGKEFEGGDRGAASGKNLEQDALVRGTPGGSA